MHFFKVASTAFVLSIAPSFLFANAAHADCRGSICIGRFVVDAADSVGEVVGFTPDNRVQYRVNGNRYEADTFRLSAEADSYPGITVGRKVVDSGDSVGQVLRIFEDGRVQYVVNGNRYVRSQVSGEVDEKNGIRAGTIVVDSGDSVGTTLALFADGRVQYSVNGNRYVRSQVSGEVPRLGRLIPGRMLVDSSDSVGTILHTFANGKVQYSVNGNRYVRTQVSAQVDDYAGISSGTTVIDASDSVGTARFVFEDGRVQYLVNGNRYVSKNVTRQVDDYSGIQAGVTVIDDSDSIGTARYAFADGRVQYLLNGNRYVSSRLARELESHPTFQKDQFYAVANYRVGKPLRFFANQKVQLTLLGGGRVITRDLISAAPDVEGYRAGVDVVDLNFREATIQAVFPNGSAVYALKPAQTATPSDAPPELISGKLFNVFEAGDPAQLVTWRKYEIESWLTRLGVEAAAQARLPIAPWGVFFPPAVVNAASLADARLQLSQRLGEAPLMVSDSQLIKIVRTWINP